MSIPRRPKAFDLEMHFTHEGKARFIYVRVRECPVCAGCKVFLMACSVCGRFSPSDRAIYFQPARSAYLTSVERETALDGINPRPPNDGPVVVLKKKDEDDGGPTAS